MKRLHYFTLRMFFGPMIMTFFIVMFILLMQFLWKYIDDLVGKGLEASVILELLMYASAGLMSMALPLAVLLASLMTMGNLGEHNELLAMKAAGISLPRIMMPMGLISLAITVGAFLWSDYVVPVATLKLRTMLSSVQDQRPELVIRPGVIHNDISGYSIRVGARARGSARMDDLLIYDHSADLGNIALTRADSGYITITPSKSHVVLDLYNGISYEETDADALHNAESKMSARRGWYRRQRVVKPLVGFAFKRQEEEQFGNNFRVMNTRQLSSAYDSLGGMLEMDARMEYLRIQEGGLRRVSIRDTTARTDTLRWREVFAGLPTIRQAEVLRQALAEAESQTNRSNSYHSDREYKLKGTARYIIEYHRKYSLSLAVLVFFLIGAPLGAIIRKGGLGVPVIISVLFFVLYYVVSITGEKFVRGLVMDPISGMWGSTFVLLPVAAFLIYKATTDSVLLSADWYRIALQRVATGIKRLADGRSGRKSE